MKYLDYMEYMETRKCVECDGLGTIDDIEPGDISYNEWSCPDCQGTGWGPKKIIQVETEV